MFNPALQVQQRVTAIRRRLAETDAEIDRVFTQRRELEIELREEVERYQDTLHAGKLAEQGAGAVAEVMEVWGIE